MKILIVDDDIQVDAASSVYGLAADLRNQHTKVYVSRSAGCTTEDFQKNADLPEGRTGTIAGLEAFLETIDILILDLGGLGQLQQNKTRTLTKEKIGRNLKAVGRGACDVSDADVKIATTSLSGVGFYHHHYDALRKVQAVFVVTRFDSTGTQGDKEEGLVARLIDPFCGIDQWEPYTAKYRKEPKDLLLLKDRIACMADLYQKGYTKFDNLPEIEFAAVTDEPVMLIGETGTGKEYVARAIHQRWMQETIRKENRPRIPPTHNFANVNCALLTEELGDSALFGYMVGAFTGPLDHSLGIILERGCGLRLEPTPLPKTGVDPVGNLLKRANGLKKAGDGNLDVGIKNVTDGRPFGTLFLDEIGDLHPSVQPKLLRFLQEGEVEMRGLGGVVRGARLRIIAATSDPRFAAFAGFGGSSDRLRGQWRTADELRRPLRSDLLFRVKAHTIRVSPVTTGNSSAVINHYIDGGGFKTDWTPPAVDCLLREVNKQIAAVEQFETDKNQGSYCPVFGHKREIRTTIRMVESFFDTARRRGGRPDRNGITEVHVKAVFRPSELLRPSDDDSKPDRPISSQELEIRDKIREQLRLYHPDLGGGWTADQIKNLIPGLSNKARAALRTALLGPPRKRADTDAKESRLRAIGFREGTRTDQQRLFNSVRDWFNKAKPPRDSGPATDQRSGP